MANFKKVIEFTYEERVAIHRAALILTTVAGALAMHDEVLISQHTGELVEIKDLMHNVSFLKTIAGHDWDVETLNN